MSPQLRPSLISLLALVLVAVSACSTPAAQARYRYPHRTASAYSGEANSNYAGREDAMQFASDIAARNGLDPAWVRSAMGQAHLLPSVQRLMQPTPRGRAKNWETYRARFVDDAHITAGAAFWRENFQTLMRAQQEFGLPPEIIAGILGIETLYGRNMGSFRVLDALATLAFDFPPEHPRAAARTAFFRDELESFLTQESRAGADPALPRGSYAGAMGLPQFMPSSIAKYAIDYDGDGHIDLINSSTDAIGSVARYFHAFGWQPGMPATFPVLELNATPEQKSALLTPDIVPTFSAADLSAAGSVLTRQAQNFSGKLALVELQNGDDPPSYVAGTQNFYVITRYNWSAYYAMAVLELGAAIKAEVAAEEDAMKLPTSDTTHSPAHGAASPQMDDAGNATHPQTTGAPPKKIETTP